MPRSLPLPMVGALIPALALAACNAERPGDHAPASGAPSPTMPAPASSATPTAPSATMPAPAPDATPAAQPGSGLAHYNGYGDMRFGMPEAQARKAWGGALNGEPGDGCHYLNPAWERAPAYFAFMFDGGKFVRYDVGNDQEVAPGGGKRGMASAEIRRLYAGRIEEKPHQYVDGGKYLRIKADDGSGGVLVFETDAAGKVTEWRAGLPPQVDYIEGCS